MVSAATLGAERRVAQSGQCSASVELLRDDLGCREGENECDAAHHSFDA